MRERRLFHYDFWLFSTERESNNFNLKLCGSAHCFLNHFLFKKNSYFISCNNILFKNKYGCKTFGFWNFQNTFLNHSHKSNTCTVNCMCFNIQRLFSFGWLCLFIFWSFPENFEFSVLGWSFGEFVYSLKFRDMESAAHRERRSERRSPNCERERERRSFIQEWARARAAL